ncbi:uncharacterized protein PITG_16400 [Phytophthora infestans T30-4]|uniref:Uncharacterized protein n=1 Tax=Phytophthora infestans (strain T30-4) TaxID=403677 RepID=D0NTJ8_PHYIT|nr:uncharacterized protein PITG_16400 [Phytophthora infestans T30-4]EEY64960.1 conserved hypothetical protein [Phytophthora infestans T30-4]|eukprot:XP_002897448.1 conserved hypothetical protein [Phytophthora infestans T30-4]
MKFHAFLVAMMTVVGAVAAADQPLVKSAAEALEQVQASALPDGDDDKENFGWGFGGGLGGGFGGWGFGGWGGWGGWGGFGPYRFGFRCGGVPGWAYPLGYWNTFGASLYGGGCGLGMPFGGLYYC